MSWLAEATNRAFDFALASAGSKSQKESFSEDDDLLIGPPTHLRWSYACSKLMDEFLAMACAREQGLPVIIARLFNTVGPRQTGRYGMVLPRFIAAAKNEKPLRVFGDGKQTRCLCHVADVVEALTGLQNCPAARGQVFNIGSKEEISMEDLAGLVVRITRSISRVDFMPYSEAYPAVLRICATGGRTYGKWNRPSVSAPG